MSAFGQKVAAPVRTYEEEMKFLSRNDATSWTIKPGFVPNMRVTHGVPSYASSSCIVARRAGHGSFFERNAPPQVEGRFYVNSALEDLVFDELKQQCAAAGHGGFLPAIKQIANVAALPGIVGCSMGMPDLHSGYGFTIGGVAAFDCDDPEAVVSPGGVGFDINCGVRLLRTNLFEKDISEHRETLAQQLFDHIPVGVGSRGVIPTSASALDAALELGMDWSYLGVPLCRGAFTPSTRLVFIRRGRGRSFFRFSADSDRVERPRRVAQVPERRLRLGRGQGALRGARAHAERGSLEGFAAGEETGIAAARDARCGPSVW